MTKIMLLVRWLGDWLFAAIASLKPSKATTPPPAPVAPTVVEINVPAGSTVTESPAVEAKETTVEVPAVDPTPTTATPVVIEAPTAPIKDVNAAS